MNALTSMVSEAGNVEEYRQACLMAHHHVTTGREVDITTMHALAVKGHVLAMNYPEHGAAMSLLFLRVHRAEPPA